MNGMCIKFDYLRFYWVKQMIEITYTPLEIHVKSFTEGAYKPSQVVSLNEAPQQIVTR